MASEFITRVERGKDEPYTVIFRTDDADKYKHIEDECRRMIGNEKPTVDAVPVRHGEWSNRRTWTHDGEWYCTACDKEITIYMGEKRGNDRYKYCPNCGAKMDGKRKDGE